MTKSNTKFVPTESELEECKYEMWILNDGPAKAEAKHKAAADVAILGLVNNGYRVIECRMVRPSFEDFKVTECTVRKGDKVTVLTWNPSYRGEFFAPCLGGGSAPFRGAL